MRDKFEFNLSFFILSFMETTVFNPFGHYPGDFNNGMIDWWDEGVNGGYNTFTFTIADQLYNSTEKPLSDYEIHNKEEEGEIVVPAGYEVFTLSNGEVMTDSNGVAFLTKDAAEALGL